MWDKINLPHAQVRRNWVATAVPPPPFFAGRGKSLQVQRILYKTLKAEFEFFFASFLVSFKVPLYTGEIRLVLKT